MLIYLKVQFLLVALGMIKMSAPIGRPVSLGVGFEVSKAHTRFSFYLSAMVIDQMKTLNYCSSMMPAHLLPCF